MNVTKHVTIYVRSSVEVPYQAVGSFEWPHVPRRDDIISVIDPLSERAVVRRDYVVERVRWVLDGNRNLFLVAVHACCVRGVSS